VRQDRPLANRSATASPHSSDGRVCLPARQAKSSVRSATIADVWRFLRPGRTGRDPDAAAAEEFWRRWARLRPAVAAALDSGELHAVEPQVAAAVAGLHRRLGWSLSGGSGDPDDRYVLVVTGEGDEGLRALTDAWLAAAPTDAGWDYHDAAQALEDPSEVTLGIGELQVPLADVRVRALADGEVLHVTLFHPALAQLSGEDRDVFSFVALDTTLGERLVEGRIGCVEPVDTEPVGSIDLMALRGLITAMDTPRPVCPTG
jgi:hypothetical protein